MKIVLTFLFCCLLVRGSFAQVNEDGIKELNVSRIDANRAGMIALAGWGAVSTATGAIGYLIPRSRESKAFSGMNAIWGVTNLGIGLIGLRSAKKELENDSDCTTMLAKYESTKRVYLINGGLDLLYIGTGAFLREHAKTQADPDVWKGFGDAILMQGIVLLIFDGSMYVVHQKNNRWWYKALNGLCVSDKGVGFNYNF